MCCHTLRMRGKQNPCTPPSGSGKSWCQTDSAGQCGGLGFRVWGISGFEFRVQGFGIWHSGFGIHSSGFWIRDSGFGFFHGWVFGIRTGLAGIRFLDLEVVGPRDMYAPPPEPPHLLQRPDPCFIQLNMHISNSKESGTLHRNWTKVD